ALLMLAVAPRRTERVERVAVLMDTPVRVVVYGPPNAADAAIDEISRLEGLWHPGRAESDVARVNAAAGLEAVKVAPETLDLAERALAVASLTDGAFDPTIGPLVLAWGFGGGENRVPSSASREAARGLVGYQDLKVDRAAGTLFLARPGMVLDLGAVAKGYSAESIRSLLMGRGVKSALVQLGGSVALLGRRPGGEGGRWQVAVQHPRNPEGFLAGLSLAEGFVDTAGDYQRFFERDGVRYHHILDPATGEPARGLASVTVIAPRGDQADAYATAAFVMGMERGYAFLAGQPGIEAILVSTSGEVRLTPGLAGKVDVQVQPWP
ncbi:MAG TPA: FAD:protein FMN transferase, partial [Symbiobacteriaceae bacterium]|nr:FAD:protein FMN transferase [Symbiobacteriaceae bacterium]